jgi:glycine cleavage system H lipoate-binding protein
MFPGVDGFHWTFGHIFFLAVFFAVVLTILVTLAAATLRTVRDMRTGKAADICWHADFGELPEAERRCRHELAGRVEQRTCPNAFDCRRCPDYARFADLAPSVAPRTFGLNYPGDRFYHRGHTWVRPEMDGTLTVGLDDMAERIVGKPDTVLLPETGTELELQGTAWKMSKHGQAIRVRAPLEGTVVGTGSAEQGWYLKLRPHGEANLRHLLSGAEVQGWLAGELDRLQLQLTQPDCSPSLADGGILVSGLMDALPEADWDRALAATFLEP